MNGRIHASSIDAGGAAAAGSAGSAGDLPNLDMILDLPLEVTVRLGRTKILIGDLLRLDKNSVLELDQCAEDPLDVVVNEKVVAHGEVLVMEERLALRITDVVSRKEWVEGLG